MKPLDIAVAGCGPAGLATALLLHRDGHRVILFERFDAPEPIGSGLMIQPTGLAVLRELGLAETILARGARIERLFGRAAPSRRVVLDVRYAWLGGGGHFGIGIHRAALFDALYGAVQAANIAIETGRSIIGSEASGGGGRALVFERGARAGPFDLIVDALGRPRRSLRRRVARWLMARSGRRSIGRWTPVSTARRWSSAMFAPA